MEGEHCSHTHGVVTHDWDTSLEVGHKARKYNDVLSERQREGGKRGAGQDNGGTQQPHTLGCNTAGHGGRTQDTESI